MEQVTAPVVWGIAALIVAIAGLLIAISIASRRKEKALRKAEREEMRRPGREAACDARSRR